jgi:hypothetical protein
MRRREMETMPTDACQYSYECSGCGTKLRPKNRDLCILLLWLGEALANAHQTRRLAALEDVIDEAFEFFEGNFIGLCLPIAESTS